MRTLLVLVLTWLMPPRGKRRGIAPHPGAPSAPPLRLIITRSVTGTGLPRPVGYPPAHEPPLVRPYLIAWENAHGIRHHGAAA
ncbi:hypothetical protein [Streptomyces sp. WMMC905]|uniref:hypothetical protein n=1 Tax=Streptomyces sp. WMMC905 TaxID=3404123 RepID=UPI003B9567B9